MDRARYRYSISISTKTMKPKNTLRSFLALAGRSLLAITSASARLATVFMPIGIAQAQTTYSWTQTAGGAQSWTTAANWNPVAVPDPVSGDTINFLYPLNQSATTTLDLGADRTAENWRYSRNGGFSSGDFIIADGYTITLAGTTPTINVGAGSIGDRLIFNNTLAGTSGFTKTGNASLVLNNAANSFSGGITLAGGTLQAASNGALGDAGNNITVSASSTLVLPNSTYARSISLGSGAVLTVGNNATVTFSGAVTGEGGIAVNSPSTFGNSVYTLSSTANTFTGPVSVATSQGGVKLTVNSLADSTSALTLGSGGNNTRDAVFVWGSGAGSALTLNQRQIVITGSHDHIIENANADADNTVTVNTDLSATSTSNSRVLYLQGLNTGNNTIAGVIPNGASDSTTSLTKAGAGKWILSGANAYTGATTVTAGTLIINGSTTSTSIVSVASGATLGGTGIVGGNTTVSGTVSPGNSPGTLSFGQDLTLNNGSFYALEAGDLTAVGQTLTLNENWTLALGSGFQDGGQVLIFTYGTLAGGSDLDPTFDISGLGFTPTGTLSLTDNGSGSIFLNGVSIPEPSTALLGGLGLLALLRRRR